VCPPVPFALFGISLTGLPRFKLGAMSKFEVLKVRINEQKSLRNSAKAFGIESGE
jgi:hypothetical protein